MNHAADMRSPEHYAILHDEDLMHCVCRGEAGAFDELYFRYGRSLLAYFTRMLNYNRASAEDALQDVFLKLAEEPERFDRSRSFKTWIFTVASNICKNYYRFRKVRSDASHVFPALFPSIEGDGFAALCSRMDACGFRRMLDEVLSALPPEKAEAFILKYQEDKSIAEIAAIQGCPEGSVKSRLHYTVKLLEERLRIYNPQLS
jgi:RNA polymerase sigma-70 factor, ECF subfamily